MKKEERVERLYVCVDGDMPLLQEGISSAVCKELPNIKLVNYEEKHQSEQVLLILCVSDPKRAVPLLQQYRESYPALRTVLLYDNTKSADMLKCLFMGCCCVIKSSLSKAELLGCIRMAGKSLFLWDQELVSQLLDEMEKHHNFIKQLQDRVMVNIPTQREIEIAKCILEGMSNEDIGKKLYLSPGTIKNSIAMILEKYEFHSRGQIISLLAL
ncbi:MAG: response regulator transcription factor [Lachnospiraceae bacterium]|nr:response regulator transcription factor [Lachnospiraceae bacterium]